MFCYHNFYLFFYFFPPFKWPQQDCILKVFPEESFSQMACLFSSSSGHQFLPDVPEGAECLAHSSSIVWSLPCQSLWTASVLMLLPMYLSIFIHLRAKDLDCFSFRVSLPIILTNASSYFAVNFSPHSFVLSNHDLPAYHSRIFSLTHFLPERSLMVSVTLLLEQNSSLS